MSFTTPKISKQMNKTFFFLHVFIHRNQSDTAKSELSFLKYFCVDRGAVIF